MENFQPKLAILCSQIRFLVVELGYQPSHKSLNLSLYTLRDKVEKRWNKTYSSDQPMMSLIWGHQKERETTGYISQRLNSPEIYDRKKEAIMQYFERVFPHKLIGSAQLGFVALLE